MAQTSQISINGITKIFGPNPELACQAVDAGTSKLALLEEMNHVLGVNNVTLEIPEQKIQVIMGLSGCGKSTLIRMLNRLIEPTKGEIWINGQNTLALSKHELRAFKRKSMAMVFQKFSLLPHKTVVQNVEYGLKVRGDSPKSYHAKIQKWIQQVGLEGYEHYYPVQLSGGMQQRVGLARALATDADILLMDEAFSALDPLIRADMQSILLKLQSDLNKTIIFITHDLDEALILGDNIAILRDGELIQQGKPQDIILNPMDDYVADFTKDINRGRILRAGDIMMSTQDTPLTHSVLTACRLEEVLQKFSPMPTETLAVINKQGKAVGALTLPVVISALKRPDTLNTTDY